MTDPSNGENSEKQGRKGSLVGVGAVLGVGIGAAIGVAVGEMSTGIWIGAVIGVGFGMLVAYFQQRDRSCMGGGWVVSADAFDLGRDQVGIVWCWGRNRECKARSAEKLRGPVADRPPVRSDQVPRHGEADA